LKAEASTLITFCSYADLNYLPRLITLIQSLRRYDRKAKVLVLCLDSETFSMIGKLFDFGVSAIQISELEEAFPDLSIARQNRKPVEYVFTLTPFLILWTLKLVQENELVAYLDADLAFFAAPQVISQELKDKHIGIIPHRYPQQIERKLSKYGKFNVGLVGIRNSPEGIECAEWWAEQCLTWCRDEPKDGKYADQGYLDQFPALFRGVRIVENIGCNLAPWNTSGRSIVRDSRGGVLIDQTYPLVFFHFHGLRKLGNWMITSQLNYLSPASKSLLELVYEPYLQDLTMAEALVQKDFEWPHSSKLRRGRGVRKWTSSAIRFAISIVSIFTKNAVPISKLKKNQFANREF
jgi:hypothetical protein